MRRGTAVVTAGVIGLAALLVISPVAAAADPPTGIQIPVIINIYKDSGTTKPEAEDAVKEANKLMKQAGFKLVVVKVNELDKEDPELDRGERDQARTDGGKELKKTPNEKGLKINFVKKASAGDSRGIAVHRNPTIIVRESTVAEGGAADTGQTIAHELSHVLTVTAHSGGADDIMQEDGKGTKFTPAQIAEMRKFNNKYSVGKCSTQWKKAYPAEKDKQQYGVSPDSLGDQGGASAVFDIDRVVLTGLHSTDQTGWDTANVHVQFALAGILATEPAFTGRYVLGFDTDANAGTGDASGFERLAQVDVIGDGLGGLSLTGSAV